MNRPAFLFRRKSEATPPVRIVLIAPGSQADVRPFAALGCGLREAGHRVRVASNPNFQPMITGRGLAFAPMRGDTKARMREAGVGRAMTEGNPLTQFALLQKKIVALHIQWMRDCLAACRGADGIAGGFGGLMVGQPAAAAFRAGVPSVVVPFLSLDQGFWADRAADLGVAPQPLSLRFLSAEKLAQAITLAVTDTSLRRRAATLGAAVRDGDGVSEAAAIFRSSSVRNKKGRIPNRPDPNHHPPCDPSPSEGDPTPRLKTRTGKVSRPPP